MSVVKKAEKYKNTSYVNRSLNVRSVHAHFFSSVVSFLQFSWSCMFTWGNCMEHCQHEYQSGVMMGDIREGQRWVCEVLTTAHQVGRQQSIFISLYTHKHTDTQACCKHDELWSTVLSPWMFPRCGSAPQKQNCRQCPDNVSRFHELLSGFGLCCSVVRSVASSFSPTFVCLCSPCSSADAWRTPMYMW